MGSPVRGWVRRSQCVLASPRSASRANRSSSRATLASRSAADSCHAVRVADAAVAHDHDAVGEGDRLIDVMGDEQHRGVVLPAQLSNQVVHADPGDRVECRERLVEQDQLGLGHQRTRKRDALCLTAGKLFGPSPFAICEVHVGQRLAGSLVGVRSAQAQGHVAEDALPRQQPVALEHDGPLGGNLDPAAVGPVQTREKSQQGALAAARGAKQDDELLVIDHEIEMVENGAISERADDLFGEHAGLLARGGGSLRRGRHGHTAS